MKERRHVADLRDQRDHLAVISAAKEKILLSYIREENELYNELSNKVRLIRERDRALGETRAIMSQNERLFTLGIMAASLAHEIKNPIIVILGMLTRLEKKTCSKDSHSFISVIRREAERIEGIMRRLSDFYKPGETAKVAVSINELVSDTMTLTEHYLSRHKHIRTTSRLDPSIPDFLFNRGQIQQVLVNLIMNAAQAMPSGGLITLTTAREKKCGGIEDAVRIVVEDTGPGISEAHIEKIFMPFFTTKPTGEGTGIGLSISKEIVERHGGAIGVESEPGKGARFTICLPYRTVL